MAAVVALGLIGAPARAAHGLPSGNVAWQAAASDADIDRAFTRSRAEKKPVLLYWGATWCPPCNQLKATLFNRQDFALLSKNFVAVAVDGDLPGAQRLGRRFKVSGYPTTVLFTPEGQEITRLPGELDAPDALRVLQLGLTGGRPVKAVLADAVAGKTLSAGEWKLLAFYSWETDEERLVPRAELAALLSRLAAASPPGDADIGTRLWLKALAASEDGQGLKPDPATRQRVLRVLADPLQARAHMDVLSNGVTDIVRTLQPEAGPDRAALVESFDAALQRLESDLTLSQADRLGAVYARVELARLGQPKDAVEVRIPEPLLKDVQEQAARVDREITDAYERQAVITAAGSTLALAGLWAQSEALLKANLARSHSPYYLMSQLGSNARKQGRKTEALQWFGRAFETSEGPATRLQWGASYIAALVDLSPKDAPRIEKTAAQLFSEAAKDGAAFEGRSLRSLRRTGTALLAWNVSGGPTEPMRRLRAQLDRICQKVDLAEGQRAACQGLLKRSEAKVAG
jgi:thiol-disulfide isomerase/thioredoxin